MIYLNIKTLKNYEQSEDFGGENFVKLIPSTASIYSSIFGVLPRTAERTTTGVEESKDSPFFLLESSTTLPWKSLVDVAITVSPLAAFSWLPMHKLHPGLSKYIIFSYSVLALDFGFESLNSNPEYFCNILQSPSSLSSSCAKNL